MKNTSSNLRKFCIKNKFYRIFFGFQQYYSCFSTIFKHIYMSYYKLNYQHVNIYWHKIAFFKYSGLKSLTTSK